MHLCSKIGSPSISPMWYSQDGYFGKSALMNVSGKTDD